ncbi:ABC transporter ATP-binding protein [Brachybacterium sp. Marseille-Q7125]|uniref:ABC transporter ATP-binding protein n=1 Tax=Brachybacterium sp. Marseille-Q7125 TaxID=2932815 RepID=UPI001FF65170|nr:ABC transporter ATP-binding protein [Brachybacterium sp. Marseille-Q7125]
MTQTTTPEQNRPDRTAALPSAHETTPSARNNAAASDRGEVILRATGLTRRYGRGRNAHLAVDGIDLQVRRGELFALLGTNGAGKTSTLEVLEGIAAPTAGTVEVFGQNPHTARDQVRPRQGLMLQSGGFPEDLTAREALAMWCATMTRHRPVDEVLADVDLAHRARTRISSLSGGEVRRLDLACAIAGEPELLFLDEPSTGLDPESRARTWRLITALRERGTTIVLTTHYLSEAEELADRIAIMHQGEIVREGTLAQIVAGHPAHIRCTLPQGADGAAALPAFAGTLTRTGASLELSTPDLQRDLSALLDWAAQHCLELENLSARAASLESVFLEIAGEDT